MTVLTVEHLSKSYDSLQAVNDVSFEIHQGDVFGLLGPNGAGKSTIMMILAGVLKPDAGTISLDGSETSSVNVASRRILGVVPQDLAIYPDLTARENLWFFGSLYSLPKKRLNQRIDEVLDQIGLSNRSADLVGTFSGGMKRRLNFGVALLHEPKLLILDEPTVGVDPQSRNHLLNCVKDLSGRGMAVIYASHYMEEVQEVCNRVAIMDHGRILVNDELEDLLHSVSGRIEITIANDHPHLPDQLKELAQMETGEQGEMRLMVSPRNDNGTMEIGDRLTRVLDLLRDSGIHVRSVNTREANLERLFLKLTGRQLRD